MSDKEKPSDLARLDARLKEAESRRAPAKGSRDEQGQGMGLAVKIGTELVGGVLVGVGIGWALDYWLGTKPWLMIVFFVLGAVAGFVGMIRTVSGIGHGVGYRPAEREREDGDKPGA
jgi:ATP synthase protein I